MTNADGSDGATGADDVTGAATEQVLIRLPPELKRRVRMAAAADDVSMSAYIGTVLDTHTPTYKEHAPAPVVG